jgi:hypothetical protein
MSILCVYVRVCLCVSASPLGDHMSQMRACVGGSKKGGGYADVDIRMGGARRGSIGHLDGLAPWLG